MGLGHSILGIAYKEYLLGLVSNAPLGPMKDRTPCKDSRVKGRISETSIMTNYDSDLAKSPTQGVGVWDVLAPMTTPSSL